MNVERLKHLIATLEGVIKRDRKQKHRHFNMGTWVNKEMDNPCGTVACALGWEAMTKYANNRGLELDQHNEVPTYKGFDDMAAACEWFDVDRSTAMSLFLGNYYTGGRAHLVDSITPRNVITRVKYLLRVGEDKYWQHVIDGSYSSLPGAIHA